jgi:hypothetical protein
MDKTLTETATEFTTHVEAFRHAADATTADATVGAEVEKFRAKFNYLDRNIAPDGVIVQADRIERENYDARLRDYAELLDREERALDGTIAKRLATAAECPPEPALSVPNDSVRLMGELLRNQQRDAAERQLAGKTLAYVARLHAETPDENNRELVRLIEQQTARGWIDVALQADEKDAEALLRLRKQIAERREARIAKHDPEVLAVSESLRTVRQSAVLDTLRRHVRSGRAIAARPVPRTVRVPVEV